MSASSAAAAAHTGFEGRVAIITGGAQGIGYGVATKLASLGAHVVLFDMQREKLDEAVASLGAAGFRASSHVIDVSKPDEWAAAVAAVDAAHGRIDVLVQCAGITGKTGVRSAEVDPANFSLVLSVNALGSFLGCRAVLPMMVRAKYGRILNVASIAGKEGNAGMVAYSASKGAVIAMTKAMGKEYAEDGITVNALAPAVVRTAMVDAMPAEQVKYMTDKIPMKRCGTIQEIADLVAFAVSPAASFTTGFTFDATGGRATY